MEKDGKDINMKPPTYIDCVRAIIKSKDGLIAVDIEEMPVSSQPISTLKLGAKNEHNTSPTEGVQLTPSRKKHGLITWTPKNQWRNDIFIPAYFIFFGLFPCIIALIARTYTYEGAIYGCFGCEFQIIDIILIGGSGFISLILSSWVVYSARNEPDPLRVKVCFYVLFPFKLPLFIFK